MSTASRQTTGLTALLARVREATFRLAGFPSAPAHTAGDPLPYNDPRLQANYVSRQPVAFPLTLPVQNLQIGFVVPQAGAGRAIIPAVLGIAPNQSLQQMPDGRIIARPLAVATVNPNQVIRPR
jgi:hypothetical protein